MTRVSQFLVAFIAGALLVGGVPVLPALVAAVPGSGVLLRGISLLAFLPISCILL